MSRRRNWGVRIHHLFARFFFFFFAAHRTYFLDGRDERHTHSGELSFACPLQEADAYRKMQECKGDGEMNKLFVLD